MKFNLKLRADEKELTPISFFFLILSDFFILWLLFAGLSEQIGQFSNEYDYFPNKYRSMLIEKSWVENNIIDKIGDDVLLKSRAISEYSKKEMHPDFKEIDDLLKEASKNPELQMQFEKYDRLKKNYRALSEENKKSQEGVVLFLSIETEKAQLRELPKVKEIINKVFEYQKHEYANSIKTFKKVFALKRILIDMSFLIPLIILLVMWNRVSFKKAWTISLTLSSHYVLLSFIPILFEICRLIIEILPDELFREFYEWLFRLRLVSLWYYIAIILFIAVIIFIIWLFQTKIFTKEKSFISRYTKSKCMNCNSKINYDENFCPVCGYSLKTECTECKKLTIKNIPYCLNCGKKL